MKAADSAGSEAAYRFTSPTATISGSSISDAGQISLEIERAWVCHDDVTNGSLGYLPGATQSAFRAHTSSTATTFSLQKFTNGTFCAQFLGNFTHVSSFHTGALVTQTTSLLNTDNKPEFVTVNIGWWGGRVGGVLCIAVDGMLFAGVSRTYSSTSSGTLFDNLYIGSNFGSANTFIKDHYIRNFQLASRPPVFAVHPALRSLAFLSDSLTDDLVPNTAPYDCTSKYRVHRAMNKHGIRIPAFNISENGGYSVGTTGTQLESKVSTVLAFLPDTVVVSGGTNDAGSGSYAGADFDDEYHDLLEQLFLGVSKTARTTVEKVFCNLPPPRLDCVNDSAMAARHADVRARIALLPAWWNATYGATYGSGRVRVIDVFGALGGAHSAMGDSTLSGDGIHYRYRGNRLYGEAVGRAILASLGA